MDEIELWEVGGCLRDEVLGIPSKDIDYSVVGPSSLGEMVATLENQGFVVLTTKEETLTAVCRVPASMPELLARTRVADFVLARKETSASVGRMPEKIEAGDLLQDLARRDFTVNAWARNPLTGEVVDPHGGRDDLASMTLRFVGNPFRRIEEDALRIARGLRFMVTKGLTPTIETWEALTSDRAAALLSEKDEDGKRIISTERLQVELDKAFMANTHKSLRLFSAMDEFMHQALFPEGLRLSATMKA